MPVCHLSHLTFIVTQRWNSKGQRLTDLPKVFLLTTAQASLGLHQIPNGNTGFSFHLTFPTTSWPSPVLSPGSLTVTNTTTSRCPHYCCTSPSLYHLLLGLLQRAPGGSLCSTIALLQSTRHKVSEESCLDQDKTQSLYTGLKDPTWSISAKSLSSSSTILYFINGCPLCVHSNIFIFYK